MSRVLLHVCCAHCGAYTIDYWRAQGHEVTLLWFNPNIHPFTEHQHRLEAFTNLARSKNVNTIIESGYELEAYSRAVVGHEYERCRHCFDLRLERTASIASRNGFDAFTTTLLISPHQKHDQIKDSGEQSARKTGTAFCYADLRKRFSDSRRQTKPMDLYRQQYCGCLYSEWERYRDG